MEIQEIDVNQEEDFTGYEWAMDDMSGEELDKK